ncbi:MAG TPA: ABC-type transport auxiliary lipoprotein family protein [Brevundimonas sp.]|nr:ABC-type transport auxiliary lipoprotein family protein [Brevundimonas sp.]
MIRSSVYRAAVVAAAAAALAGCALLKSPDPVQTYRFGGAAPAASATIGTGATSIALRQAVFPEAVEGDRLLGVTGTETAYIKGARWVSPAEDLYMESLENAFAGQATRVRIVATREAVRSGRSLDIDVRSFEARYDTPGAAPTIVITARARVTTLPERNVAAERMFSVEQPAAANRVAAIVEAFDVATRDLNTQIVAWTEANVR